ncbi:MAG: ankyrin repeat domain-containing protein [Erythrobacter sp.]|nr:ankyrin repeat domain-containing protein [Erythrobacter sp.]
MGRVVLRKLGMAAAIASASLASLVGLGAIAPVNAQVYSKGYEFLEAVEDRDGDTATDMLNEPGTTVVNTRDLTSGDTGLHIVTARRDVLWVRFLLQRGADPNIRNKKGQTPLQLATSLGFVDGVEELIKRGAQVNVTDLTGETPLMSAVHQRNIALISRLLKEGADPDQNDNSGRSARDYVALMSSNEQIVREFEAADAEREAKGTTEQYGPSF